MERGLLLYDGAAENVHKNMINYGNIGMYGVQNVGMYGVQNQGLYGVQNFEMVP